MEILGINILVYFSFGIAISAAVQVSQLEKRVRDLEKQVTAPSGGGTNSSSTTTV
jgi:hypothetical protein